MGRGATSSTCTRSVGGEGETLFAADELNNHDGKEDEDNDGSEK